MDLDMVKAETMLVVENNNRKQENLKNHMFRNKFLVIHLGLVVIMVYDYTIHIIYGCIASGFTFMKSKVLFLNGKALNFNLLTTGTWDLQPTICGLYVFHSLLIICLELNSLVSLLLLEDLKRFYFMEIRLMELLKGIKFLIYVRVKQRGCLQGFGYVFLTNTTHLDFAQVLVAEPNPLWIMSNKMLNTSSSCDNNQSIFCLPQKVNRNCEMVLNPVFHRFTGNYLYNKAL